MYLNANNKNNKHCAVTQVDSSCCNYIDGGTTFSTQVAQSVLSGRFPTRGEYGDYITIYNRNNYN